MRHKTVAVVDIRSADLTALIGERGVNHSFVIKDRETLDYLGYEKGVFLDEKAFKAQLKSLLKRLSRRTAEPIDRVTVGIPSEFLLVREKNPFIAYPSKKRISRRDADELLSGAVKEEMSSYYTPVERSTFYFGLSDKSLVEDPVFCLSTSLSARMSLLYASNYFTDLVEKALAPSEEIALDFIPTPLAQGMFLLREEERKGGTLFIDFDIYGSELLLMDGNAVVAILSLPVGEATCLQRLSKKYATDEEDLLYDMLYSTNLFYIEANGPRTKKMNVGRDDVYYYDVNEVIYSVVDEVVSATYSFLQETQNRRKNVKKIVITGRGLPEVKGFKEYFSRYLQIPVFEAKSPMPYYNKEICLSAYSLMDMAIDKTEKKFNNNLTFKFIKKFGG